jgi:hypothetical protein
VRELMKKTSPVRLTMVEAAKAIGLSKDLLLTLALNGARRPADQGGDVVEIEYGMDGNELMFTKQGIDRFLKRCPVGEMITSPAIEKQLAVHRAQVSVLVYTGIQTEEGQVVRLPVWVIGGREYIVQKELDAFAKHFQAANERKAARELKKRYNRPGKQTQEV